MNEKSHPLTLSAPKSCSMADELTGLEHSRKDQEAAMNALQPASMGCLLGVNLGFTSPIKIDLCSREDYENPLRLVL